ncbi:MAG: GHKL domain-containing protein [Clostridia bacterium]
MIRWIKHLYVRCAILFVAAFASGILYLAASPYIEGGMPQVSSTIAPFGEAWSCRFNEEAAVTTVSLPAKLALSPDVHTITLTRSLPDVLAPASVLRFPTLCQTVRLYIGGELRARYGDLSAPMKIYPYATAAHMTQVDLREEDCGQEVKIVLAVPPLFVGELSLIRQVEIGRLSDFILRDLLEDGASLLMPVVTGVFALILLAAGLILLQRGLKNHLLIALAFYTLLWGLFYLTDGMLLHDLFNQNPSFCAFNDLWYYLFDQFMPILSFGMLLYIMRPPIHRWLMAQLLIHAGVYLVGTLLFVFQLVSINYFRPIMMALAFVTYLSLFRCYRKAPKNPFATAIFVLLMGYFLDYIKYSLSLLPLSSDVIVFLQLQLAFMFFLSIALVVYFWLVFEGIIKLFVEKRLSMQRTLDTLDMRMRMNRLQYEQMMHNNQSLRVMRHDYQHHLRTMRTLCANGDYARLEDYLKEMTTSAEALLLCDLCESTVGNATLSWFRTKAMEGGIRFESSVEIPNERASFSIDLCVVLSNALQNALEACQRMQGGTPFIRARANPVGKSLTIVIENSFSGEISRVDDTYLSSKRESGHGLGLASIRASVEHTNGCLEITHKEGLFTLRAVLNDIL